MWQQVIRSHFSWGGGDGGRDSVSEGMTLSF